MVEFRKQQVIALEKANELQDTANDLQLEMINEIETNNRVTSTHNTAIRWLTVAIVALGILTIWANYSKTGRYAFSLGQRGGVLILDTKTSQLWGRIDDKMADMGTIKNPKYEKILIELETSRNNK